jgi:ribosomal protein L31
MKKETHPENYRYVVFQDLSCDYSFLTRSTVATKEKLNGKMARNILYINWKFQINHIHFLLAHKI